MPDKDKPKPIKTGPIIKRSGPVKGPTRGGSGSKKT